MPRTQAHHRGRPSHIYNTIERTGLRRGFGGSKAWLYVGTGMWALRIMRRLGDRREEILISERLKPGQRLIIANAITTLDGDPQPLPRGRRARKQARKQAKAEARAARSRKARKARKQAERQARAEVKAARSRKARKAQRRAQRAARRSDG